MEVHAGTSSWYDVLVDSDNQRKDTRRARRAAALQSVWDAESAAPHEHAKPTKTPAGFLMTLVICVAGGVSMILLGVLTCSTSQPANVPPISGFAEVPISMIASLSGVRIPLNSHNFVEVDIGGQKLQMGLDSVSSRTWIPTTACTAAACKKHTLLDVKMSPSFASSEVSADSSDFKAMIATDDISLSSDIKVENVEFFEVRDVRDGTLYDKSLYDGTLGLGFPSDSKSLVNQLYNQDYASNRVISVKFGKSGGGYVEFGGADKEDYVKGDQKSVSKENVSQGATWEVDFQRISVGSSLLTVEAGAAVLDLLSPTVILPENNIRLLAEVLDLSPVKYDDMKAQSTIVQAGHLAFETQCSRAKFLPSVKIVLGGASRNLELELTPEEYLVSVDESKGMCIMVFTSKTDEANKDSVIIGMPFFQKYEVIFDLLSGTVAFR